MPSHRTGKVMESGANDDAAGANLLPIPATANGRIERPGDMDIFRFAAKQGQRLIESVQALGITKLGFESIHLPHAFWQAFSDTVGEKGVDLGDDKKIPGPGVEMVPVKDLVDKLRRLLRVA